MCIILVYYFIKASDQLAASILKRRLRRTCRA